MSRPSRITACESVACNGLGLEVTPAERRRALDDRAMLVAAGSTDHGADRATVSKIRVLRMVGRRSLPSLIEATLVPSALFYGFFVAVGPAEAMCAALVWSYGSVLRRLVSQQRVPGVLQLAVACLTVRTIVGLLSGTFMYFLQPIATTLALAFVFLGSLWFERPMIARMAADFCPVDSEISRRPAGDSPLQRSDADVGRSGIYFLPRRRSRC